MSVVNLMNVAVLDNPTEFLNQFQFEITFECSQELEDGVWVVHLPLSLFRSSSPCAGLSFLPPSYACVYLPIVMCAVILPLARLYLVSFSRVYCERCCGISPTINAHGAGLVG